MPTNPMLGSPQRDGLYFSVTTMMVDDNRSLRKPVVDKDGYYSNVPMAVLGTVTRNKTQYDVPAFIEQLKGPSTFATRITEGVAAGEYGHPFIGNPNTPEGMSRLLHIEPTRESIHMRSIQVKHIPDLGMDLIMSDVKPSGPYGQYFAESMDDPSRNTAFSLRGLSRATYDRKTGITYKKLISLVTFDSNVVGSGYKESTKRYMSVAQEQLGCDSTDDLYCEMTDVINCPVSVEDLLVVRRISIESFTDTEVNEIMKANRLILGTTEIGIIDPQTNMVIEQATGKKRNLFGSFMAAKRGSSI